MQKMKQQEPTINYALKYGLQFGVVLIVFNLINYIFKLEGKSVVISGSLSFLNFVITIVAICLAIIHYRKNALGGFISYGHAISYSMSFMFFAAVASGLVSFIYFKWIDTFYLGWRVETIKEMVVEFYYNLNLPDETIDTVEDMLSDQKVPSPFSAFTGQVFGDVFRGLIIALVAAIFLQKKPSIFDNTSDTE